MTFFCFVFASLLYAIWFCQFYRNTWVKDKWGAWLENKSKGKIIQNVSLHLHEETYCIEFYWSVVQEDVKSIMKITGMIFTGTNTGKQWQHSESGFKYSLRTLQYQVYHMMHKVFRMVILKRKRKKINIQNTIHLHWSHP